MKLILDEYGESNYKKYLFKKCKNSSKTARAVGKVADGFRMAGSAPSQLLVTEAKAQVASAEAGAGAGSILYDKLANVATDINVATNSDLAEVSK